MRRKIKFMTILLKYFNQRTPPDHVNRPNSVSFFLTAENFLSLANIPPKMEARKYFSKGFNGPLTLHTENVHKFGGIRSMTDS